MWPLRWSWQWPAKPRCPIVFTLFFSLFEVFILKGRKINKIKNLIIFVSNLIQLGLKDGEGRGEEVDNPYLVSFSYYDICIWVVCGLVWLQKLIPKLRVFKRDWTACSNYDNHFTLNNQHNWGDLYDQSTRTWIFTLTMNDMFIQVLKTMNFFATTSI